MWTGSLNTNFFQSFSSLSESISSVSWHALSLTWDTLAKWMIFLAELTFLSPWVVYFAHCNLLFIEMRTFSCSNLDWFTLPLCTCKIQLFLVSLIRSMFYSFQKKKQQMKFVGNTFQMRIQRLFAYFCRVQNWNSYKYNLISVAKDSSHGI